jgi:putative FmdB family regulatory protein
MPTYEYGCTRCGTHVEVFQRFGDEPLRECGVCGGPLRKVFHPAGIVFKGSGFYATDSRASSKKPDTKEKEPAKAESPSDGQKKDAKADSRSDGQKKDAKAETAPAKEKSA